MTTPTRKRKKAAPKTFKAAYDILKTNAAELQQQDEPDIDNLMTTVEESIAAYVDYLAKHPEINPKENLSNSV